MQSCKTCPKTTSKVQHFHNGLTFYIKPRTHSWTRPASGESVWSIATDFQCKAPLKESQWFGSLAKLHAAKRLIFWFFWSIYILSGGAQQSESTWAESACRFKMRYLMPMACIVSKPGSGFRRTNAPLGLMKDETCVGKNPTKSILCEPWKIDTIKYMIFPFENQTSQYAYSETISFYIVWASRAWIHLVPK